MNRSLRSFVAIALLLMSGASHAQSKIFDNPENLEVLPEDITAGALRQTMMGFSFATGLRCEGCHVGEAGQPLDTFDFPADDKDNKLTARVMLKIVTDVNKRLEQELGTAAAERVQVECMTCHRGQNKPRMLDDLLAGVALEEGVAASVEKYRALREEYYGSHTYDFAENTLISVARRLAKERDARSGIAMLDLNLEFFPQSVMTLVGQGELLARDGDKDAARKKLRAALEIEPDNQFVQGMLKRME